MMEIWLAYGLCAIPFLQMTVVLANWLLGVKLPADELPKEPFVSILIPARNESENIEKTLEAIRTQAYQNIEILILDDNSEDDTALKVNLFCQKDSRFKLLNGKPLPQGWLGKNWACHQLAQQAQGEYFIFTDADVTFTPLLIGSALAEMRKKELDLLSIFPDQEMQTIGERIVVPIMHYILLTLLPLPFIRWIKHEAFAAANGQFMLFRADVYRQNAVHEFVKDKITEDIESVKYLKRKGYHAGTYLGNQLVFCRMYKSYYDAVNGFSKNLLTGFGSVGGLIFFLLSTSILPIISMINYFPIAVYLLPSVLFTHLILADLGSQSIKKSLPYILPMYVALWHTALLSIYKKLTRRNMWKGRIIG